MENKAVGIRHADHVAPSIRKSWQSFRRQATGRSIGIVRSRTQTMGFFFFTVLKADLLVIISFDELVDNCY
jgi:hypothetical protein